MPEIRKCLEQEGKIYGVLTLERKAAYINIVRKLGYGLVQEIHVSNSTLDNGEHIILEIGIDVSPAWIEMGKPEDPCFLGARKHSGDYRGKFYCPIQTVDVMSSWFQAPGWPEYKIYNPDNETSILEEFSERFLPWFEKRSEIGDLINLLENGDVDAQKIIRLEFEKSEKSRRNIWQRLFPQPPMPCPKDGVTDGPRKNCLLGMLYYAKNDFIQSRAYFAKWDEHCEINT